MNSQLRKIRTLLRECGYGGELVRADYSLGTSDGILRVELAGFAQQTADARTACVAVLSADESRTPQSVVSAVKSLGAPVVFLSYAHDFQCWKQGAEHPTLIADIKSPTELEGFFTRHNAELNPQAILRAKTTGRFDRSYQLDFVDVGLLPMVEEECGRHLSRLLSSLVGVLMPANVSRPIRQEERYNVLLAAFWLIAAKILKDKGVPQFEDLNIQKYQRAFRLVEAHYGRPATALLNLERESLSEAADIVSRFSNMGQVTTESLAFVYENSLVTPETRELLGIHSTPPYVVDYILNKLEPWIREIPEDRRNVLEPACGHGAFLVSSLRLLRSLSTSRRHNLSYFRKRLHGVDIDLLALELARLSLTLADIPNPNGWDLHNEDVFNPNNGVLEKLASEATIVLANPPFEALSRDDHTNLTRANSERVRAIQWNKAAELLSRVIPHLTDGAVLGVVLPATLLHGASGTWMRRTLLTDFELGEVCRLPDGVFSHSDSESGIILARRRKPVKSSRFRYVRVRESDIDTYRLRPYLLNAVEQSQSDFISADFDLRISEFGAIWKRPLPHLHQVALIGKGLEHRSAKELTSKKWTVRALSALGERLDPKQKNVAPGFAHMSVASLGTHPGLELVNLDPEVIRRPQSGCAQGIPQIVMNYSPISRGFWRLQAFIDQSGHPATSSFLIVRPFDSHYSLEILWALLNSPIANGYAFDRGTKRHQTKEVMSELPLPQYSKEYYAAIELAANRLKRALSGSAPAIDVIDRVLEMDLQVLRAYRLPSETLSPLLDAANRFARDRKGLGHTFTGYPTSFLSAAVASHVFEAEDTSAKELLADLMQKYQALVFKKHFKGDVFSSADAKDLKAVSQQIEEVENALPEEREIVQARKHREQDVNNTIMRLRMLMDGGKQ